MPISTNLSVSPYFDDYDVNKDYYKILFKPSTSVQVRELNQMQSILQNQIEKFGDNIFKRGTIIDGCNFVFNNALPYVKLLDNEIDGTVSIPANYKGNFIKNSANLVAVIIDYADGFEATDPNLKTVYVNYVNSGNDFNTFAFTPGETLTIYNPLNSVYKVDVVNGGTGFSNSDTVIFTPVIAVTESSGTFQVGDFVVDNITAANLEIVQIDRVSLSSVSKTLLKLKPSESSLITASSNSEFWTIQLNSSITNDAATVSATVDAIYGESAAARLVTLSDGSISDIIMSNRGRNYIYTPYVAVKSANNQSGVSTVDLQARNYLAQIKASSAADAVGNAYSFSITSGTIYQKGHFLRVSPQSIIVSKYDTTPNNVVVGFNTAEEIINFNQDTSLLDNALGTPNETAPGADRLKLTPELLLLDKDIAAANAEFLSLVEWNDGFPYKQNQTTQYNRIGDEIARSGYDQSGNFVLDTFQVTTTSPANTDNEGRYYTAVVDPGQAYISGFKVQTLSNYKIDLDKGVDTQIGTNIINLNYGNYVKIKEVGGTFLFNIGDDVKLYNASKNYISNTSLAISGNTSPIGDLIGTAKMRSLVYDEGLPGTANTEYRLYLFEINMNPGRNFEEVRSVYYDGDTYKGIADVVTQQLILSNPSTSANGTSVLPGVVKTVARLEGTKDNRLLFQTGFQSVKNSNNTSYVYRTIFTDVAVSNSTGVAEKTISTTNEDFPYTGNLTNAQKLELYVVPTEANLVQYTALTGDISVNTTSNVVVGSGTSFFDDFEEGDYVHISTPDGVTANTIRRVVKINSSTSLQIDSPSSFANTGAKFRRAFPKNVPVPFGSRDGLDASVTSNTILQLNFNHANGTAISFQGTGTFDLAVGVNVRRSNVTSSTKTANRNKFVKIAIANNSGGTTGPWCIGVPDAFRLRNVYIGNSSVSTSSPELTSNFYIDHNQNANYLGLGYLYKNPNSRLPITNDDHLLVEFDYYTRNEEGYFDTVSYLHTANAEQIFEINSRQLSDLTDESNSFEVPEVYTYNDEYYDLLNTLDFRPAVANTVAPSSNSSLAPVNPSETVSFDQVTDKKFPYPDSTCTTRVEYYLGRTDDIYIGQEGNIYVLKGIPDVNPRKRFTSNHPKDSLKLQTLAVPAYPNIPQTLSNQLSEILNLNIGNEKQLNIRLPNKVITPMMTTDSMMQSQPIVYTMEDIGNLERRIKDLEYYVSLSLLETNLTNKIIPSSIDNRTNRFKFGFFADDFSTQIYSDLNNPQYAADIEVEGDLTYGSFKSPLQNLATADKTKLSSNTNPYPSSDLQKATNRLVPSKYVWSVNHFIGENIPYYDQAIIEQNNATYEPVVVTPNTGPQPCIPNYVEVTNTTVTSTNSYFYAQQEDNRNNKEVSKKKITFGTSPGTVTIYFDNYGALDKISIYQGNTLVSGTHASFNAVQNLSTADKAFITSDAVPEVKAWYNIRNSSTSQFKAFVRSGDFVKNTGKITFNHNPSNGVDYLIQVDKGPSSVMWKYLVVYPTTVSSSTKTIIDVNNCIIDPVQPPQPLFTGTLTVRGIQAWSCSNQFKVNLSNHNYTAFVVDVTGLKPNTEHYLFLDDEKFDREGIIAEIASLGVNGGSSTDVEALLRNRNQASSLTYPKFWVGAREVGSPTTSGFGFRKSQPGILQPLITDSTGKLSCTVYVSINNLSWVMNQLGLSGGIYSGKTNHGKVTYGSSGYSKIEVKATNSYASLVVANRTPNKILPYDPKGTV